MRRTSRAWGEEAKGHVWDDADLYDLETTGLVFDVPFWRSLLDQHHPRRVLELACGTGRLTLPLAAQGVGLRPDFAIVGLDLSVPLLDRARAKAEAEGPAVAAALRFVEGDMRSFTLGETFDLIFVAVNSFALLLETDDQLACLRGVADHLAPGGRFALDLVAPQYDYLVDAMAPFPIVRVMDNKVDPTPDVRRFVLRGADAYDPLKQVLTRNYTTDIYHAAGRHEERFDETRLRMTFPRELELLLATAGLVPVERYGNVGRAPFIRSSKQYTWIMERQ
jgi:SAM-dependent methyltransferase